MDVYAAFEEVARWCADQTAIGDPDAIEVECHGVVCITIGESAPPWKLRRELGSSAGASSPVAQLRYDLESREWLLHHGGAPDGWCREEDAVRAAEVGPLLAEIASDRAGRFQGLQPGYRWPWSQ